MGTITRAEKYRCYNDCEMGGCPGHVMMVEYHTVSDGIHLSFNGRDYYFDPETLGVFIRIVKSFDRAELSSIFEEEK